MKKHQRTAIEIALSRALKPVVASYRFFRRAVKKARESIPYVYNEIDGLVKGHIVNLAHDKQLLHSPDIDGFAKVIAKKLVSKLPTVNEEELSKVVSDKYSNSFLDLMAKGSSEKEEEKDYTSLGRKKLFKRILIANRGEIALRIIRSCRELGISPVVISSKADKDSLAVRFADKACSIGDAKGYLNIKRILNLAKKAKVDAIHPGYGFLAENNEFARLCGKKRIKFIGPSLKAINVSGHKVHAKNIAMKNGIPVILGSEDSLTGKEEALELAEKIGYPIILKASAGGGGKGVRVVSRKEDLESSYDSVQAEAKASFDDSSLYMEKYVEDPRHIEFQILADKYGNVIHLGERECSIQRRHQKLIEESPSCAVGKTLREKMGDAAVRMAKAMNYVGAGTVEFLLDKKGDFYFMEMNTRIQVEHGITEMVTGVDLIKEQIKIASGAKLDYKQRNVKFDGWAIECRINAECPTEGFCPSTGTIMTYLQPGGPGIRVCSSCHAGHVISPHYDSLIAKLMVKGTNRDEAIARMKRALGEFIIEGVDTTMAFHKVVLNNPEFVKGNISTFFIEKNKIIEQIKPERQRRHELSKKEKILIVSTAVSDYMERKRGFSRGETGWAKAARQELIES